MEIDWTYDWEEIEEDEYELVYIHQLEIGDKVECKNDRYYSKGTIICLNSKCFLLSTGKGYRTLISDGSDYEIYRKVR